MVAFLLGRPIFRRYLSFRECISRIFFGHGAFTGGQLDPNKQRLAKQGGRQDPNWTVNYFLTLVKSCRNGIAIECTTKNLTKAPQTPSALIISVLRQVARMHVDDRAGTNHNMRCWVSTAGRGKTHQCKQLDPSWPKGFDCSETGIFWSHHFPYCVFCSRTPNHKWFTQYGRCISPTSPISGAASSQYGLGITMAWKWACSGLHLADGIQSMVGNLFTTPIGIWHGILPRHRWVKRVMAWQQQGAQTHWPLKILLG